MIETLVATLRTQDPLQALAEIASTHATLEAETAIQVRRARNQGRSWEIIAAALGVSRQAAHKKYAGRTRLLRRGRR